MFSVLDQNRIRITADRGSIHVMAGTPPTVEIDQKYPSRQLQQYFDILVRAKCITIRDTLDGFWVEYPNGVTVCTYFGPGSYSENYDDDFDCLKEPDSCTNTELMIQSQRPEANKTVTLTDKFKAEAEDWGGILPNQTSEDVLRALQWADRFSVEVLEELFRNEPTMKERIQRLKECMDRICAEEDEKRRKEKAEKEPKKLEACNV